MQSLTEERRLNAEALARGCEVCGDVASIIVARAEHFQIPGPTSGPGQGCMTRPLHGAPLHPRCLNHAAADAYVLDKVKDNCRNCRRKAP